MNKRLLKGIAGFVLAMLAMFALMQYRSANDYDKEFTKISLSRGKTVEQVIDIGKEGELKYLLQPNVYTAYFRLQARDKAAGFYCSSEGLTMMLSQGSKKGVWRELEAKQPLRWEKGSLPLSVELYVPREAVKQYHVGQGKIRLYSGDKEYATLLIDIVNSRYQ